MFGLSCFFGVVRGSSRPDLIHVGYPFLSDSSRSVKHEQTRSVRSSCPLHNADVARINPLRLSASTRAHTKSMAAASSFLGTKRARAPPPLRLILVFAAAAAALSRLVSASTSVPSSSSELCLDETAACFDSPFCWDCVAQFADSSDFCGDLYPVLVVDAGTGAADECEIASALYCCSFDASGQDCLGDEVTTDFFRCGLLEGSGCVLSDSPCSGGSGVSDGSDGVPATTPAPAPAVASPTADDSQDAPPAAPSTSMPTETVIIFPAPVEDVGDPSPPTPSPVAVDRDAASTSGAAGGVKLLSRSWAHGACWGRYSCVFLLVGGWAAAAAAVVDVAFVS